MQILPFLLIGLFGGITLGGAAAWLYALRGGPSTPMDFCHRNEWGYPGIMSMLLGATLFLVMFGLWIGIFMSSRGEVASLVAFHDATLDSYTYTVEATGAVVIEQAEAGLIDIAYSGQGQSASERLRELRDKVDWYNGTLERLRTYNRMGFVDPFLTDPPERLEPIILR